MSNDSATAATDRNHDSGNIGHHRRGIWSVGRLRLGWRGAFTGVLGAQAGVGDLGALAGLTGIWGILLLGLAVIEIAFGIGAWTLKPGLDPGLIWSALALSLASWTGGFRQASSACLIRLVIYGAIVYYLMTPEVKKAFRPRVIHN